MISHNIAMPSKSPEIRDDLVILEAENISKLYPTPSGPLSILRDINLSVNSSETVAIVGKSGSGKSTLLALLAGLELPSDGEIRIVGQAINALDEDERAQIRNEHIGFVFQQFHLLPNLTALENVSLPLELAKHIDATKIAEHALDEVGLADRRDHFPRQLSGGEQQRVAFARAFCTVPTILFADEPTGNLDEDTASQIIDMLFALNKNRQTTLILVTHDENLAARCSRSVRLSAGTIYEDSAIAS